MYNIVESENTSKPDDSFNSGAKRVRTFMRWAKELFTKNKLRKTKKMRMKKLLIK
jgi:hypothetical protein